MVNISMFTIDHTKSFKLFSTYVTTIIKRDRIKYREIVNIFLKQEMHFMTKSMTDVWFQLSQKYVSV